MDKILIDACEKIGVRLNSSQVSEFFEYMDLLLLWNEKINLTAITEPKDILLKHFADSVSILPFVDLKDKNIIDVGTGAGFPGIPIKIAERSVRLTLLDSLNKRIKFLQEVVDKISLSDVNCVHLRAEEGGQNPSFREKFDICVSRAVAGLDVLAEYCLPFVRVGGIFISLKGPNAEEEVINAKRAIDTLGGIIEKTEKINIPFTDITHTLIMIKKVRQTPIKYPRKSGKISKSPIK